MANFLKIGIINIALCLFVHRFASATDTDNSFITSIADCSSVFVDAPTPPLTADSVHAGDIVINEVMANPSPPVYLPEFEYVELFNRTDKNIQLDGYTFCYGTTVKTLPPCLLPAQSFLLLMHPSAVPSLAKYGATLPVLGSLSALNNSGQYLSLTSADGALIAWIDFNSDWYADNLKAAGGWSLEMIDAAQTCSGAFNYKASTDRHGGSPGQPNAVAAVNPDMAAPHFSQIAVPDEHTILYVSKAISTAAVEVAITPDLPVATSAVVGRRLDRLQLTLAAPVMHNRWYDLHADGEVSDCAGFAVPPADFRFALPQRADSLDVVINEIMFRPLPDGEAFVEFFNRSQKAVAVNELQLATRSSSGKLSTPAPLSDEPFLLLPAQYLVVAHHSDRLIAQYSAEQVDRFIDMPDMPQLTRETGQLLLLSRDLSVVDEVHYDVSQHSDALDISDGVSLERVNPDRNSLDPGNWHTAAQTVGFATPARQNSQFIAAQAVSDGVTLSPTTFSPNNDGIDDLLNINYRFDTPALSFDLIIFDSAGRRVRQIIRQQISGTEGVITWDGLDDLKRQALTGVYIVYLNVYNSNGYSKIYKIPCVLAGQK